jgi:hypothetical protein
MRSDAVVPPDFTIVLTGYDRGQVDAYLANLQSERCRGEPMPQFRRVLRGYEITQVDGYIRQVMSGGTSGLAAAPAAPEFTIVLRGYERTQVDRFVAEALARIAELERTVEQLTSLPDTD